MLRFAFSIGLFLIVQCAPHCPAQDGKGATRKVDKFITVYGAKIHYVEAGNGAPLILIHGLADDVAVWESVIPPLAARFRIIAFDQIGFGRSDKPLLNYRVSTFVDFLDGFMTELKIERASVVGNSLGSWVAASFALAHPGRVDRLVLCDAAGYAGWVHAVSPRTLDALKLASRGDIRYLGPLTFHNKQFYEGVAVDDAFRQRVIAGDSYTISRVLDSLIRGDDTLDNRLHAINRPTLVLRGRDDKLIPLTFAERFHQEIANSRLRIIDNCGHAPQIECPNEFSNAVLQFLSDSK